MKRTIEVFCTVNTTKEQFFRNSEKTGHIFGQFLHILPLTFANVQITQIVQRCWYLLSCKGYATIISIPIFTLMTYLQRADFFNIINFKPNLPPEDDLIAQI